jgi:hypothetical protein
MVFPQQIARKNKTNLGPEIVTRNVGMERITITFLALQWAAPAMFLEYLVNAMLIQPGKLTLNLSEQK